MVLEFLDLIDYDFIDVNLNPKPVFDDIGVPLFMSAKQLNDEPIPISPICFPKNTIITTDQGKTFIENIIPNYHTIDNNPIVAITKTTSMDNHLVCFEKHAIALNCPSEKTIMSKDHRILYKDKLIEAYKFLGKFVNVHKIEYNGEILYNVLMHGYCKMSVNNLICETLHPDNIVSKLCTGSFGKEYKNNLIIAMNNCVLKNDYAGYKKLSSRVLI